MPPVVRYASRIRFTRATGEQKAGRDGVHERSSSGVCELREFRRASLPLRLLVVGALPALVSLVTNIADGLIGSNIVRTTQYGTEVRVGIITGIVGLALLLPSLAVFVRRLHDTDRKGVVVLSGHHPHHRLAGAAFLPDQRRYAGTEPLRSATGRLSERSHT